MTNKSDEKMLTVGDLFTMMNKLVEVDGFVGDDELHHIENIKKDFDNEEQEISSGEAMSILSSLAAADSDESDEEMLSIRKMIESYFEDTETEEEVEKSDTVTEDIDEQQDDTEEVEDSSTSNEEIPDSTRDLNIEGDAHMWIHDLDLHYGNAQAVYNVSIPFERNAVTALIGPSGCGKSTLLRCLNRMNDLISICRIDGKIELEDDNIMTRGADLVTIRRRAGMVFQKPNPFPKSIYDNVAYGVRLHYNPSRRVGSHC